MSETRETLPPRSRLARRISVGVIGSTVVLIGIAMIVLPGPAVVVIPAGLAILATEFAWAARLHRRFKHEMSARLPPGLKDKLPGWIRRRLEVEERAVHGGPATVR